MNISVLTENTASKNFLAEHGLSYLIEIDDQKILFDTGHSDVFLKNASMMGIDIEKETETVILSHGHWDHGNGLRYIKNKKLIAHPDAFIRRFRKKDLSPVGLSLTREEIKNKFRLIETKEPFQVTSNLFFLGEIPRNNDFEAKSTNYTDDFRNEDFIPDDSALAAIVNGKLIVVTGCSHSGICNITEYAKKVTGIPKAEAVIGGFHLKEIDEQTRKTIEYFRNEGTRRVFPSHCTELPAMAAFYHEFKNQQIKTGQVIYF
jgi:7,8-dihydropterin-6-yl-methyl-4-(beta-D-ribofuranosyl)aminobenzene 5'-phosphate synthase